MLLLWSVLYWYHTMIILPDIVNKWDGLKTKNGAIIGNPQPTTARRY